VGSGLFTGTSHQNNLVPYHGSGPEEIVIVPCGLVPQRCISSSDRSEFKENTELKLRVEELALHMLNEVLARHEAKQKSSRGS
jgi:hypothetical protein